MAKEIAPTCEVTGLPLPILPPGPRENGAFLFPHLPDNFAPNNHHPWYDEKELKRLGIKGEALQNSRIQNLDWYYHRNAHDIFKKGPILPKKEEDFFCLGVLGVSGVIPRQAIDVSERGEYSIVELTDEQHLQIAQKTTIDQKKPIARFLVEYATKQKITDVIDETIVEEFLDSRTDNDKKREIARLMLRGAIDMSLEGAGLYKREKDLKEQGLMAKRKPKTFYSTAKQLVRVSHLEYFASRLEDQLA